jgi:hypothetical protein
LRKPWKADGVFRPVPPVRFAAYAEPDQVEITWTIEAERRWRSRMGVRDS